MRDLANFPADLWLRQRAGELGLALGLGLAFAVIGPFSTDESPFLPKLGYWAGLLACWFVVAALVERGLRTLPAYRGAGLWARRACLVAVASAPMLLVVAPATDALNGFDATPYELAEMYLEIAVVAAGVVILADGILGQPALAEAARQTDRTELVLAATAPSPLAAAPEPIRVAAPEATDAPLANRLIERLPPRLRGPIVCLEMEDHYVRVHTDKGSALVLMRLGDAMREAAPTRGAQAHRSWWVAADAIEAFERAGRAGRLRLKNGLVAPVSQPHLRAIDEIVGRKTARLDAGADLRPASSSRPEPPAAASPRH